MNATTRSDGHAPARLTGRARLTGLARLTGPVRLSGAARLSGSALLAILASLGGGCTARALDLDPSLVDPGQLDGQPDLGRTMNPPRPPGSLPQVYCERIVVLNDSGGLALFDPVRFTFEDSATLGCRAVGASGAYAISFDRMGQLWVTDPSGGLFIADAQTGACAPTSFVSGQEGFRRFDMSFAPLGPDTADEALYMDAFAEIGQTQLARTDPKTLALSVIGPLPISAELTTTSSGELWGLFRGAAPHAGRIDKSSAAVSPDFHLGSALGNISGYGVAFSSFAGSFYIFLLPGDAGSSVYRMRESDGAVDKVVSKSGRRLIGATAAICLP